jgi:hypothetical protein
LSLNPGEVALADQFTESVKEAVAELRHQVLAGDAACGDAQNLANFISYLRAAYSPATLAALLVIATRQLPPSVEDLQPAVSTW